MLTTSISTSSNVRESNVNREQLAGEIAALEQALENRVHVMRDINHMNGQTVATLHPGVGFDADKT
jgi:hypothetical protein